MTTSGLEDQTLALVVGTVLLLWVGCIPVALDLRGAAQHLASSTRHLVRRPVPVTTFRVAAGVVALVVPAAAHGLTG